MDKLMDNRWFIKGLALLLAILLYSTVPNSSKLTDVNVPGDQTTDTIADIPVKAYFDTENLVVSGIPNSVKVQVQGPRIHVQSAKSQRNFEVYVDLTKAKIGTQTVKLQVRNLSDKLKATITPAYVKVSVQEKVSKKFRVGAEYNQGLISAGYTAGTPIIDPGEVTITGAKDVIDRIAYVKATLNLGQSVFETFTQDAAIKVLDRDFNKLNVSVEPATVKVTLPIKHTSKTVSIDVVKKGTAPSGVKIDSIELDTKEATISGTESVLKDTQNVRVEVDVSKITGDTTLTLPVIIPDGISKVTPEQVKATIKVNKNGSKSVSANISKSDNEKIISDIPIKTAGLSSGYKVQFNDPVNQMVNISVYGPSDQITQITSGDFAASVDLTGLSEGDHFVKIQVDGPLNVKWYADKTTADITISKA